MVRILLVDDHPLFREGTKKLLQGEPDFEVVGGAGDGLQAVEQVSILAPDVVLLDINLPKLSGLKVAEYIRAERPDCRILVFTMHNRIEYVQKFREVGANGYLLKDSSLEVIIESIRTVIQGSVGFQASGVFAASDLQLERIGLLTTRENEILHLIGQFFRNKEIAERFGISVRTIEVHRAHIMKKLGAEDSTSLIQWSLMMGGATEPLPGGLI